MILKLLQAKVQGVAVLNMLLIGMLVATVSSISVFYVHFQRLYSLRYEQKIRLVENVNSGLEYLQAKSDENILVKKRINLFNSDDPIDNVKLTKHPWGVFSIMGVETATKYETYSKVGLWGYHPQQITSSLYVSDNNKPLYITGKTEIEGTYYLPKKGIKRAYIEGESFIGKMPDLKKHHTSKKDIPKFNLSWLYNFERYVEQLKSDRDSIVEIKDLRANSFTNSTLLLEFSSDIYINQNLSGNIIIECQGTVTIGSSASLENIIIRAKNIVVESNLKGNAQLFAYQSIEIGENVELYYPSIVGLLGKYEKNFLSIEKGSSIQGEIFMVKSPRSNKNYHGYMNVAENSIIEGAVFSDSDLDFKGTCHGSLVTQKFILRTASSIYENHVIGATLNFNQRHNDYLASGFYEESNQAVMEWLN